MWSRGELKDRAKACLKKYYWPALAVTFLVGLLGGGSGGGGGSIGSSFNLNSQMDRTRGQMYYNGYDNADYWAAMAAVMAVVLIVVLIAMVIGILFQTFVGNVMTVGGCRYFMESRAIGRSAGVGKIFYGFGGGNYLNVVKTMFLKNLFVGLWSLLLVIPGIYKSYQYYMVPYILSENPDIHYKDALAMSKDMMDGHKWDTFVLQLSFIGWNLLGMLLCCIGVIFVVPYIQATEAELYAVLRNNIGAPGLNGFGGEYDDYQDVVYEQ